jgi:hypothetical protein
MQGYVPGCLGGGGGMGIARRITPRLSFFLFSSSLARIHPSFSIASPRLPSHYSCHYSSFADRRPTG